MINIDGNWSGKISGTNNGNVFIEMQQNSNMIQGNVRINDSVHGTAIYTFDGEIHNTDITLTMTPDKAFFSKPITQEIIINNQKLNISLPADAGHGIVTVNAKYTESGIIEGKWISTIGTGGNLYIKTDDRMHETKIGQKKIKKSIFISYCHVDELHLKRLKVHLKPLEKEGLVDLWDDSKIKAGDKWEDEINNALSKAAIAILIISADFLASDFIVNNELPPLLEKAQLEGTRIVPIILSSCRFSRDKNLSEFQALNTPDKPLLEEPVVLQEKIWDKLSRLIEEELNS